MLHLLLSFSKIIFVVAYEEMMGIVENRCRVFNGKSVLRTPEPRTQECGFKMTICLSVCCCLYMNPPNTKGPNLFKPTQDL